MKVKVEMILPDDIDPSDILAHMQECAVMLVEGYSDIGEDDDFDPEEIENEVSVKVVL